MDAIATGRVSLRNLVRLKHWRIDVRKNVWLFLLLLVAFSAVGQARPEGPLASRVGHEIELRGNYSIGKLANIVMTDSWSVYLFDPRQQPADIKPGSRVVAIGKLEFHPGSPPLKCGGDGCGVTTIAPHYFIRSASVVALP